MSEIDYNQISTEFLNKNNNYVRSISAGNNCIVTDDGAGGYNIEIGQVLWENNFADSIDPYVNTGAWGDLFKFGTITIISNGSSDWLEIRSPTTTGAGLHSTAQPMTPYFSLSFEWSNQNKGYSANFSAPIMSFSTGADGANGFTLVEMRDPVTSLYGMGLIVNGVNVYSIYNPDFLKDSFNEVKIVYDGTSLLCGINETPSVVATIDSADAALNRALKLGDVDYTQTLVNTANKFTVNGLYRNMKVTGLV